MNLEEIKQRVEGATPGEWVVERTKKDMFVHEIVANSKFGGKLVVSSHRYHDIKFIAHARQDIPDLIAEVENLKERLKIEEELFENSNVALGYAQEENVRLREALAFYASEANYLIEWYGAPSTVHSDSGEKARQVLGSDSNE